jgi:hypothetical protein
MKFDLQMIMFFIGIGLLTKEMNFRRWAALGVLIFAWIMVNWMRR